MLVTLRDPGRMGVASFIFMGPPWQIARRKGQKNKAGPGDLCRTTMLAHSGTCKVMNSSVQCKSCTMKSLPPPLTGKHDHSVCSGYMKQCACFSWQQTETPHPWYQWWATSSSWIKRPSRLSWHEGVLTQRSGAGKIRRRSSCTSCRSWSLSAWGSVTA